MTSFPDNLRGREVHLVGLTGLEIADVACFLGKRGVDRLVGHDLAEPAALHEHFRAAHIGMEPAEREAHWEALQALPIELRLGADYLRGIGDAEIIIVSQAWRLYPQNGPLAEAAVGGAELVTPLAIYLDVALASGIRTLGVTGSNGKSTTTNMAAAMLRQAGVPLVLAGNYRYRGPILEDLAALSAPGVLVLEVSNHHLMAIARTTDVAVVTNVTPNHLEEHEGFAGYVAVKRRMAERQPAGGTLILNADDPVSREFASVARGVVMRFSTAGAVNAGAVNADAALVDDWLAWRSRNGWERWLAAGELRVPGAHNVANALAASLAARALGVDAGSAAAALRTFEGVPGRLELVREVGGVRFMWDVESTTPESTVRALEAFAPGSVHLIAGGEDKGGLDYGLLAAAVRERRGRLWLLDGTASAAIREACRAADAPWRDASSLEEAVSGAYAVAAEKDTVLVSPAAKGFYNAHVRGKTSFPRIVKRLRAADRGVGAQEAGVSSTTGPVPWTAGLRPASGPAHWTAGLRPASVFGSEAAVDTTALRGPEDRDPESRPEAGGPVRRPEAGVSDDLVVLPEDVRAIVAPLLADIPPTPLEWQRSWACWLKREDLGEPPTHKSRGLLVEVAQARAEHARGVVLSSSGNAALAAGYWCRRLGLRGLAFLSDRTEPAKIERVRQAGLAVVVTAKPRNFSRYAAQYAGLTDLRPSLHPLGAIGYRTLAGELLVQLGRPPSDIFCFVNSGLTLHGLAEGFGALRTAGRCADVPALHAVQCTVDETLARAVGAAVRPEANPAAGALGARSPARVEALAGAIRGSGGGVWMVSNDEVAVATERARAAGLDLAAEAAAGLAGLFRARGAGAVGDSPVLVVGGLAAGAASPAPDVPGAAVHVAESYANVRQILESLGLGRANG